MRPDVRIGICTYRRPHGLEALLSALAALTDRYDAQVSLGVLVADDDPDGSAAPVVARWSGRFAAGVQCSRTASGNIATARNRLLEMCGDDVDLLAFLDDDEVPEPGWLEALLDVRAAVASDLTVGVVRPSFPAGSPSWLRDRPFQTAPEYPDRSDPEVPITGNLLISMDWSRRTGLRFDPDFGVTGGEDSDFFRRARMAGAVIRYAARSVVHEIVPPERATLRYQLHREFRIGTQVPRLSTHTGWARVLRMTARAARQIATGLAGAVVDGVRSGRAGLFWGLARAARGAGTAVGLVGARIDHR